MKIEWIDTGYFYADGGAMFGAIPKTAWSRRYPSDELNGCVLAMRTLVITLEDRRVVLVDTGAGDKHVKQLSYYRFFDLVDLKTELARRGIRTEQVTDVILTHLHFDHCGYCTRQAPEGESLVPAFPKARHWVSEKQWADFQNPNPLEADSFFPENMEAIERAGLLLRIDSDTSFNDSIRLCLFDGHTPGQIVPYIRNKEQTVVFPGDVIPLAASVSPAWISAYDTYPVDSYREKVRLLEEAVAENQLLIYCHDAYTPASTVRKINDFYKAGKAVDTI